MGYINDILNRVVEMQKQAITCDAFPRAFYQGEAFPYFVNRVTNMLFEPYADDDTIEKVTLEIAMRLIVGHVTQGYVGEPESTLYDHIVTVKTFFQQRELLQSTVYPTALDNIESATITDALGLALFINESTQVQQVGTQFTLQVVYFAAVDAAYL